MIYHIAYMKSIKADIAKKEITVSFTVDMNDTNLALSQDLSRYTDNDSGAVEIEITPRQMKLNMDKVLENAKTFRDAHPDTHVELVYPQASE